MIDTDLVSGRSFNLLFEQSAAVRMKLRLLTRSVSEHRRFFSTGSRQWLDFVFVTISETFASDLPAGASAITVP